MSSLFLFLDLFDLPLTSRSSDLFVLLIFSAGGSDSLVGSLFPLISFFQQVVSEYERSYLFTDLRF